MATDHSVDKNAAKPVKKFWPIPAPEVPAPDAARLRRAYQGESFKPGSNTPADPHLISRGPVRRLRLPVGAPPFAAAWWSVTVMGGLPASIGVPMLLLGIPIGITGVVGSLVGIGRVSMRFSGRGRLLNRWRGHWALPDGLEQVELILVERAVAATMRIEDSPSISVGRLAEVHDARRLAEVLWQIFERARQVSELRRAIGSSPFDADESLVDLLAPAVSAVAQAANSLRTRVEEVEQYRDCVARADAAHATLLRLREVDTSNERVAEIITSMNWDRPSLDSTLLSDRIAATEENWATLITEAAEHWPAP